MGKFPIIEQVCYGGNRKAVVVYKCPSQIVLLSCEPRALSIDFKQSVLVSLPPTHSQPHPHIYPSPCPMSTAFTITLCRFVKLNRDGRFPEWLRMHVVPASNLLQLSISFSDGYQSPLRRTQLLSGLSSLSPHYTQYQRDTAYDHWSFTQHSASFKTVAHVANPTHLPLDNNTEGSDEIKLQQM